MRREKYGSSVYILEPNIKEGEGALRDLHTALWVAKIKYKITAPRELIIKGVLSEEELAVYVRLAFTTSGGSGMNCTTWPGARTTS